MKLLLTSGLVVSAVAAKIIGVAPKSEALYVPDSKGQWACLNHPEIKIDFSKVNDDYCDCPDGSDEPGTSACKDGKFFCENKGFKSSYIPSFKVNDGVCDYEFCCDGSDEWNTDANCENKCEAMSKEYNSARKAKLDKLTKGLKIKNEMLAKVKSSDSQLAKDVETESKKVAKLNDEVYGLKKEVTALNTEFNKEAMEFLAELKSKYNETDISTKITKLIDTIKLIRLGVEKNLEKSQLAQDILGGLETDFDRNINDLVIKKNIEEFEKYKVEDKIAEYVELNNVYLKHYDLMLDLLNMYTPYMFLEKNKVHFNNWRDFLFTRKGLLHDALLKLLLLQDEMAKSFEEKMEDIEKNYNPNFNNDVVKHALKKIGEYNDLKKTVQETVLDKIDYVNDYDGAVKDVISATDKIIKELGRELVAAKELVIDEEHNAEELEKLKDERRAQAKQEEIDKQNRPFLQKIQDEAKYAVADFLGVYDNLPEKKDDFMESVPYDLISAKLDSINNLATDKEGADAYSAKLRELNEKIASKQEEIQLANEHVADLVEELNDAAHRYGPGKILKAIENEQYKAPIGEYEYVIDFTGDIRQTGNGQNALIGRYNGNIRDLPPARDGETKLELEFDNGAKCWSGPIRQAKVTVFCGEEVKILKVTEPEVCQYFIEVTSPIACFEADLEDSEVEKVKAKEGVKHDEL